MSQEKDLLKKDNIDILKTRMKVFDFMRFFVYSKFFSKPFIIKN